MIGLSMILAAAMALPPGVSVLLQWQAPPPSSDTVVGYNVYRTDRVHPAWAKINKSLVHSPKYKDQTVQRGESYIYTVRSVDGKGNQSAPSMPWSVTIPKKSKQKIIEATQSRH